MIPAYLHFRVVSPTRVQITITDERAPADLAQENLPGVPAPTHEPKKLLTFYCDPNDLIRAAFSPMDFRVKAESENE